MKMPIALGLACAGLLALADMPAQAELRTSVEGGVTVTRGVPAAVPARYRAAPEGVMTLPDDYRGLDFGRRRLLVDGRYVDAAALDRHAHGLHRCGRCLSF